MTSKEILILKVVISWIMAPMTGDYNKLNASQSTVWKFAKPLFAKALQGLTASSNQPATSTSFRVADLGCATGGNSVAPLSFVAVQLPTSIFPNLEVFLGDLPHNSWGVVVTTVTPESITPVSNVDDTNVRSAKDTFVYMAGRTFYDCAPAESLDLSFSLVAMHWMKSYAGDIPTGLYATCSIHNLDAMSLQAWKEAGARDLADFMKARYEELKVGGRFIAVTACPKQNGDNPWSQVGRSIYDILSSKVESPEELATCLLPICYRTEDDVRQGFAANIDCSWELEDCEFHETKDPIRESLERGEITSTEYGKTVIDAFRAVCHPTCVGDLGKFMSQAKAVQLLEAAYAESVGTVASDPEKYNLDVSFWYVMAKKV